MNTLPNYLAENQSQGLHELNMYQPTIEWYYTSTVWTKERDEDGEYTGKLVRANKGRCHRYI